MAKKRVKEDGPKKRRSSQEVEADEALEEVRASFAAFGRLLARESRESPFWLMLNERALELARDLNELCRALVGTDRLDKPPPRPPRARKAPPGGGGPT